jgi:hypothetical protein
MSRDDLNPCTSRKLRIARREFRTKIIAAARIAPSLMCDPEFRKSAESTEGRLPNRSADTRNGMLRRFECMESFADLVSNYEGFQRRFCDTDC